MDASEYFKRNCNKIPISFLDLLKSISIDLKQQNKAVWIFYHSSFYANQYRKPIKIPLSYDSYGYLNFHLLNPDIHRKLKFLEVVFDSHAYGNNKSNLLQIVVMDLMKYLSITRLSFTSLLTS